MAQKSNTQKFTIDFLICQISVKTGEGCSVVSSFSEIFLLKKANKKKFKKIVQEVI